MIHFDFIVEDAEAETIFDGISYLILEARDIQIKSVSHATKKWCEKRLEFLEELKEKMKNRRVQE